MDAPCISRKAWRKLHIAARGGRTPLRLVLPPFSITTDSSVIVVLFITIRSGVCSFALLFRHFVLFFHHGELSIHKVSLELVNREAFRLRGGFACLLSDGRFGWTHTAARKHPFQHEGHRLGVQGGPRYGQRGTGDGAAFGEQRKTQFEQCISPKGSVFERHFASPQTARKGVGVEAFDVLSQDAAD